MQCSTSKLAVSADLSTPAYHASLSHMPCSYSIMRHGPQLFELLPTDCLLRVLALCSCRDVLALACTCKEYNRQLQVLQGRLTTQWCRARAGAATGGRRYSNVCSCQLQCNNLLLSHTLQEDDLWRLLAEMKWGRHVGRLAQVAPGGWAAWTRHRLAFCSQPISPLDLVQVSQSLPSVVEVRRCRLLFLVCSSCKYPDAPGQQAAQHAACPT